MTNDEEKRVQELIQEIQGPIEHSLMRFEAVCVLGEFGEKAAPAVPALINLLKHSDWEVRFQAADTLGKIGEKAVSAVPALIQALKDPDGTVRRNAAEALGKIGVKAVPALAKAARECPELRPEIHKILEKIEKKAKPDLGINEDRLPSPKKDEFKQMLYQRMLQSQPIPQASFKRAIAR